jgi:hypothetical protein
MLEKFSSKKSNLGQSGTHWNVLCAPDCSVMPLVMRTTEDAALKNFIYKIHGTVNNTLSRDIISNGSLRGQASAAID